MPCLDMQPEDLLKYKGTNPKPEDFDEYWETALAEMRMVEPDLQFVPAKFKAPGVECYDMYFTGVRGARIHCRHIRPANLSGKIPAVLQFHGYGANAGDWYDKLGYPLANFAIFAFDTRGQGGTSQDLGGVTGTTHSGQIIRGLDDEPQKLLFRDIFLDTAELASLVMNLDFIDESKVYVKGGSQGGALALACAALEPRVSKAAVMYPFLNDYKRVWDMGLDDNAYGELKYYFRNFDPRHERENEIFTKLGYIDIQNLAGRIKAETIMFTGLRDFVCPPSTQFAAYNKMTCKKQYFLYPEFGHEAFPDAEDMIFTFFTT